MTRSGQSRCRYLRHIHCSDWKHLCIRHTFTFDEYAHCLFFLVLLLAWSCHQKSNNKLYTLLRKEILDFVNDMFNDLYIGETWFYYLLWLLVLVFVVFHEIKLKLYQKTTTFVSQKNQVRRKCAYVRKIYFTYIPVATTCCLQQRLWSYFQKYNQYWPKGLSQQLGKDCCYNMWQSREHT